MLNYKGACGELQVPIFMYVYMTGLQKYTACQQCTTFHRVQWGLDVHALKFTLNFEHSVHACGHACKVVRHAELVTE